MKLELSLYAQGLKNVAGAFKGTSDPYAIVTKIATTAGSKPIVLGKTEVVKNSLSPQWTSTFQLDYELGTPCKIAISIYDEVSKGDHKSMGSAIFDIADVLGARGNTKAKRVGNGGTVFATVRKAVGSGVLRLKLKGHQLKNVEGFFSKSDPFFELSRQVNAAGAATWDNIYRSKSIKNNLSPTWEDAVVELSTLCGGDLHAPILISVYDHESSGNHTPMGQVETSVDQLVEASTNGDEDDTSKALKLSNKGKDTGSIVVAKAHVAGIESVTEGMADAKIEESSPTVRDGSSSSNENFNFVDYVTGGLEMNCIVAIDFTGSNGNPRTPGTLHYIDPNSMNDYEKAMSSILGILSKYDTDQKFPVLGFGAKYDGVVNHCFQCGPDEEAKGIKGVLEAYNAVFKSGLILSSPTVFTGVIQTAAARAKASFETAQQNGKQSYTILLIISDGAVSDIQATAQCLKQISDSPLSIVIVGVGDADFSGMQFLDDMAKDATRDIAQFVEFNKYSESSADLTSATLKEVPSQLERYFQSKGIQPLPPVHADEADIAIEDEDNEEEIDLSLDIQEEEIVVRSGGVDCRSGF